MSELSTVRQVLQGPLLCPHTNNYTEGNGDADPGGNGRVGLGKRCPTLVEGGVRAGVAEPWLYMTGGRLGGKRPEKEVRFSAPKAWSLDLLPPI